MPLSPRSRFLLSLACLALGILPLQAQINGAAPSVTSMGFGGTFLNGIRPSVTSLGPITYGRTLPMGNCCANFFMPSTDDRGRGSGHHRRHHDGDSFPIGVFEPASIPYAVSEADDEDEEPETEPGLSSARVLNSKPGTRPSGYRDPAPVENNKVERTVDAQPSTVLIFKDGHRSDVVNYAIVGDTLFDFAPGRTRKILLSDLDLSATHQANDDRGIDFEVPETTVGQ